LCAIEPQKPISSRDRAAEADQLALDEDRRDHRHVGRVRAAAFVRVVDQIRVAVLDVAAIGVDHRAAAGGKRAHMERQHDMLCDHIALRVHDGAGGILGFAHDGREAGAEERVLHLLHDAGERGFHDLDIDRTELRLTVRRHHADLTAIRMFLNSSTRADCPGGTTVVASS
jgi:hypothetical protein